MVDLNLLNFKLDDIDVQKLGYKSLDILLDSENHLTIYFKYVMLNALSDFCNEVIKRFHTENDSYVAVTYKQGIPDYVKENAKEIYRYKFHDDLERVKNSLNDWKKEHLDYYREQVSLPSSEKLYDLLLKMYVKNFIKHSVSVFNLDQYVLFYKETKAALRCISNHDLDPYCTETRLMLNIEHKAEYNEFKSSLMDRIPSEQEFIDSLDLPVTDIKYMRLTLDRKYPEQLSDIFCDSLHKSVNDLWDEIEYRNKFSSE